LLSDLKRVILHLECCRSWILLSWLSSDASGWLHWLWTLEWQ